MCTWKPNVLFDGSLTSFGVVKAIKLDVDTVHKYLKFLEIYKGNIQ